MPNQYPRDFRYRAVRPADESAGDHQDGMGDDSRNVVPVGCLGRDSPKKGPTTRCQRWVSPGI